MDGLQVLFMKPADFALRSERSRASARHLLKQRQRSQERVEVILGRPDSDPPRALPWHEGESGQLSRIISIPEGMTLADGLLAMGGFTTSELDQINLAHPSQMNCGSILVLRR
jgi:hypothetical protein